MAGIRRFARPRPAKHADHGIVHRSDGEFCAGPWASGMFETADALILNFQRARVNYGNAAGLDQDTIARNAVTVSARSFDRGQTWNREPLQEHTDTTFAPHDGIGEGIADLGPLDLADRNTLIWSLSPESGTAASRPYVRVSKDAGRNWSRPYRVPLNGMGAASAHASHMVRSDGRSMLMLTQISQDGFARRPMAFLGTVDGSTWQFLSFVTRIDDAFGAADGDWTKAGSPALAGHRWYHPRTVELRSGRILCTLHCQRDPRGNTWSEVYCSDDGGATWGFLSRINDFGAPTSLVRMRDGRLVAVYGYRLPPYGVRATVSEDDGESWGPEIILRDDGGSWDLGDPQAIESTRGKVMAAYGFNSRDDAVKADGGVRHIARTIFTPD